MILSGIFEFLGCRFSAGYVGSISCLNVDSQFSSGLTAERKYFCSLFVLVLKGLSFFQRRLDLVHLFSLQALPGLFSIS